MKEIHNLKEKSLAIRKGGVKFYEFRKRIKVGLAAASTNKVEHYNVVHSGVLQPC